jgi:hypothetical protein
MTAIALPEFVMFCSFDDRQITAARAEMLSVFESEENTRA